MELERQFTNLPRHKFRAFPRKRCDAQLEPIFKASAQSTDIFAASMDSTDTAGFSFTELNEAQEVDFVMALEEAQPVTQRAFVEIPCDREFVKSSALMDSLARTAKEAALTFERSVELASTAPRRSDRDRVVSTLSVLADSLENVRDSVRHAGFEDSEVDHAQVDHAIADGGDKIRAELEEKFDLLNWLNESDDFTLDGSGAVAYYEAFPGWEPLPASVQFLTESDEDSSATSVEKTAEAPIAPAFVDLPTRVLESGSDPVRRARVHARRKRALFAQQMLRAPEVTVLNNGRRIETFDHGAVLIKDAHGRVIEVRSAGNTSLTIEYDKDGQPQSFTRLEPDGSDHSKAVRDQHGVVVRGHDGRVRAQGEVMVVDPSGVLSVSRFDGQFWSLDLLRGFHVERRTLMNSDGSVGVLTGVFAGDGYRMMTRFQKTEAEPKGSSDEEFYPWYSTAPSGTFRFYGRDGSVVQFESEDDLLNLQPSVVCPSGSRKIGCVSRTEPQARTAWDSVREYVTSYLSA